MTIRIGEYLAEQPLARGSSAVVWSGRHVRTGQRVAMKLFDHDGRTLANREAAIAAMVDHPHLVPVVGVASDGHNVALITALAEGGCLADVLERRTLRPGEVITVLFPMAGVLARAHELDLMHGDLSPANILFESDRRPLLADLGAARAAAEVCRPVQATPGYVAPEVATGAAPTAASDVFSLGAVALHCLTGRPAWPADDLRDVSVQSMAGQLPDPGEAVGASAELIGLVRRMLDLDPLRRPGAATVVLELRDAGRALPVDLAPEDGGVGRRSTDGSFTDRGEEAAPDGAEGGAGMQHGASRTPTGETPLDKARPDGARVGGRGRHSGSPPVGEPAGRIGRTSEPELRTRDLSGAQLRERALTRLRPESVAAGGAPGVAEHAAPGRRIGFGPRRRTTGAGGRGAGRAGSDGGTGRGRFVRTIAVVITALVLAGGAIAAGLTWAGAASPGPRSVADGADDASATTVAGGPSAAASATDVRSASTTGSTTAPTGPTLATTALTGPAPATTVLTGPAPATTVLTGPAVEAEAIDWRRVIDELDGRRSAAFRALDDGALRQLYTPGSPLLTQDLRTLDAIRRSRVTIGGSRHVIVSAEQLPPAERFTSGGRSTTPPGPSASPVTVRVVDSLPDYPVRDASGTVVGRTEGRGRSERLMQLVATRDGFRIADVQEAG